ncbi:MBL fold metallo-hydrolase [Microtetraspora sp. NBRC 16547]|uniref:MBL fold metallo-hydrolase n=1 Tax=Microtetraspora sp. NBRC 16547 TaxID=3030993 RepID=UPI0024A38574|nr:MBL fold metallo-hydrolase [Microtetraspora sp. NBRC 16547]GLX02674.1 MBL fold metallo-hydrolase [Microtetraspora sp. NBRC 16547]
MRSDPTVEELRPGLWAIPVPIPDHPLRYTVSYLFEAADQAVIVDPGWCSDDGWSALQWGLRQTGRSAGDIAGIVVTHAHPDHHGLAERLRRASGAWIAMHALEAPLSDSRGDWDPDLRRTNDVAVLRENGVPDPIVTEIVHDEEFFASFEPTPIPDRRLEDGDRLPLRGRDVRVVWTPGHAPGHICLYDADADVFLSGDHVLPRISPQIFDQPHNKSSALSDYLASLDRVAAYDSAEVLPAHEYRFRGLAARTVELTRHHEARLAEIETLLRARPGATAWFVTTEISWSRGWDAIEGQTRRIALGETVAHLNYLIENGRIRSSRPDPDGPRYYELADGGRC